MLSKGSEPLTDTSDSLINKCTTIHNDVRTYVAKVVLKCNPFQVYANTRRFFPEDKNNSNSMKPIIIIIIKLKMNHFL